MKNNPFLIAGYQHPVYFCDREKETESITNALLNGRNLTLLSPRRMGKTGLIHHVFHRMEQRHPDIAFFYMDIFSTQNLGEFVKLFASAVFGKREEPSLKEIFAYLQACEKNCVIAIDEFQQIAQYPEKGVESLLRSHIQFLSNVNFIFSGSKRHVMNEIFLSAKRPFYQSTQILTIDKIDKDKYYRFAADFFKAQGKELTDETFSTIYDAFNGHTWYIQTILNRLYSSQDPPDEKLVNLIISEILDESGYIYESLLSAYSPSNIRLLKAIALEKCVKEINAGDFIIRHNLKAASSVNSSLKKLIDKELVYKTTQGYIVYDRFLAFWLRQQPF